MTEAIQVFIADDHRLFRDGLRALLLAAGVEVVGEAATGEEAAALVERLQPDVVLMDIQMPGLNGIEATRRITAASPHVGVIIVTMFEDDDSVFAAMRAGARGYVLKGAGQEEVVRTIRAVAGGEALFGPAIAARLMAFFNGPRPTAPAEAFPELTAREREVLDLLAAGHNNEAIAARLVVSRKTVRNHVSNIFSKLQVAGRAEAIIRAREAGMG
ncbi:Two component transcriptional regulator, LuxR family [Candidatus Promineifilum breve]|uniref:Two component transcriptional regulator, LuxR family n=1 Tax=Candidatus Promineifilum breve TaxID=1806508 RepID=A0A160T400_9CHLR|nr:response regulator transcription factor [Candidatus Promineifilum breve]CUS03310.2 Two component transcriptional regulator, LuxR family [Candidatus Promineifilum breve]